MSDIFGPATTLDSVATRAAAITPSDSVSLTVFPRAIYIGGAGNVSVLTLGGDTVTFSGLAAGSILPVRVQRVNATSTTATNLVAIW